MVYLTDNARSHSVEFDENKTAFESTQNTILNNTIGKLIYDKAIKSAVNFAVNRDCFC